MRAFLAMPGNETMAAALAAKTSRALIALETRQFPDGESYVRIAGDVVGLELDVVCTLAWPDAQFLPLVFAASAARELGAVRINLVAPYLAYMRQDKSFKPGEAVSSVYFASLLSGLFDGLITVDPHLHRRRDLGEIFTIPTRVEHAAPILADWIAAHVRAPLVIGPDSESEQWVAAVAERAGAPHVVLSKTRLGDRQVEVVAPDLGAFAALQPVLIDDIISSGRSMIEAARGIEAQGLAKPYCLAVHALVAEESYTALQQSMARIVTTDTIAHPSNGISVADLLASALGRD
jgi:ribose-phosphate pyrophosphokinase